MDNATRLKQSYARLNEACANRKLQTARRIWVEENTHIHALNYLYYRYFTNSFRNWMVGKGLYL